MKTKTFSIVIVALFIAVFLAGTVFGFLIYKLDYCKPKRIVEKTECPKIEKEVCPEIIIEESYNDCVEIKDKLGTGRMFKCYS